jgi:ABC-type lipoprotein export system ATPase subunit
VCENLDLELDYPRQRSPGLLMHRYPREIYRLTITADLRRSNEYPIAETMIQRSSIGAATFAAATSATSTRVFDAIGIEKKFDDGQVQALRGVNLQVMQGELLAITGPSGCGKTTLLQMLGALDRPTAGTLLYRGKSIPNLPEGLEHRLGHFPAKLSGGERQRVAIAGSLANGPSVLLADEPTGNLDSENARLILELLFRLHCEQNMTLVLVTHDTSIAEQASRIVEMKDGRVVSDRGVTTMGA